MFEETMSSPQLLEEYYTDLSELQSLTQRYDESDYVRRYLWKHHKHTSVAIDKIFHTSRGNRYVGILLYEQSGVGRKKMWNWSAFHVGLMKTKKGDCAIAFYTDSQQAVKITPHFFFRYKERFSEYSGCDWRTRTTLAHTKTIADIIAVYLKRNMGMTWIETNSVFRNKTHIFGPVNDGVALLQWDTDRQLLQANTFITFDMLDERQTEMVGWAFKYLTLSKEERMQYKFPDFISSD